MIERLHNTLIDISEVACAWVDEHDTTKIHVLFKSGTSIELSGEDAKAVWGRLGSEKSA